jgi:uncharacterized protein (TIGR00730 family)
MTAINLPDKEIPRTPFTLEAMEKVCAAIDTRDSRTRVVSDELQRAFTFIKTYPKSVTFFGSARSIDTDPYYKKAQTIAYRIVKELDYAVVTGGGPGIMEAANKGANEAGGRSIGFTIQLPDEQRANAYATESIDFAYFFTRKVALSFAAEAYIFFPGGFGTLDELFELATLVQTHKIEPIPIILVGDTYWRAFNFFIEKELLVGKKIDDDDMELYIISENEDEILRIVGGANLR